MKRRLLLVLAPLLAAPLLAQAPTPVPAPTPESPIDTSTVERILKGEEALDQGKAFSYEAAGRRDPFRSLLEGRQKEDQGQRPPGLRGMGVQDVRLEGIFKLPSGYVAMVQGSDNLSYIIRPGTVLFDGIVESIEPGRVVFRLQVTDPKSLKPYRELVRTLQ